MRVGSAPNSLLSKRKERNVRFVPIWGTLHNLPKKKISKAKGATYGTCLEVNCRLNKKKSVLVSCSNDDSESEPTRKTLDQLKEKVQFILVYVENALGFFRPFRVGNIPLRGFTTRPSVSPVRCFKTF